MKAFYEFKRETNNPEESYEQYLLHYYAGLIMSNNYSGATYQFSASDSIKRAKELIKQLKNTKL